MSTDDYDYPDWGDIEAELIEKGIRDVSEENVRSYLGGYGDAISLRIQGCLADGRQLLLDSHFGPAVTLAATATEIMLGFLVLRPLMQGAFLSEEWAEMLTRRVIAGRFAEDGKLIPRVAAQWGIDLMKLSLTDGTNLWETITKELWTTRNAFVHAAEPVQKATAERGLECADLLQVGLVKPLAERFGLTWPRTSWTGGSYQPRSPFGIGTVGSGRFPLSGP